MSLQPAVEPICCNHAPSDICDRKFGVFHAPSDDHLDSRVASCLY